MKNAIDAMKERSSTRGYTDEPLTEEELQAILQAGLQAPTARNRQELHFTVLKKGNPLIGELETEKNRLAGVSAPAHDFSYEAPVVVILSAQRDFRWSTLDAGIAVENMAIAAEALGLGSVIIGCIADALWGEKRDAFASALCFPDGYEYKIAIALGHKAAAKEPHTYDAAAQVTLL